MPGRIFEELVYNSRIFGGITPPESAELAERLYRSFVKGGRTFKTSSTVSEVVKLMENTFRDVNIALANEFAYLAHQYGIDVFEAIELANTHPPRVRIHTPGIGVGGGHCLPKDPPHLLVWPARDDFGLIRLAREINDGMPLLAKDLLFDALKTVNLPPEKAVVAVLGLAYKGGTATTRGTPRL